MPSKRCSAIVWRVAAEVALLHRAQVVGREAAGPRRPEKRLDRLRPANERQPRRIHLRRHGRDEIVGADRRFQEVVERPVDARRRAHPRFDWQAGDGAPRGARPAVVPRGRVGDVKRVEKQHEQTIARVAGHLVRLAHVARVHAIGGRRPGPDDDVLEGRDGLGGAVFLDQEILGAKVAHGEAVCASEHIQAHEVHAGTEGRALLVRTVLGRYATPGGDQADPQRRREGGGHRSTAGSRSAHRTRGSAGSSMLLRKPARRCADAKVERDRVRGVFGEASPDARARRAYCYRTGAVLESPNYHKEAPLCDIAPGFWR